MFLVWHAHVVKNGKNKMTFSASPKNLPDHLTDEQLQTVVCEENALSAADRAHLDACPACGQRFAAMQLLDDELLVARLSEPSAAAKERYHSLFRATEVNATGPIAAVAAQIAGFADAVKASVMWNGRERLALQGVRSAAAASYRMLYSTKQAEIELMIEPVADNFKIEGELLPLDLPVDAEEEPFPVLWEVYEGSAAAVDRTPIFVGESDRDGRFHIPPMPAGAYTIYMIPVEGDALLIESLELV